MVNYTAPDGYRLAGFHGTKDEFLFSLGFIFAKKKAIYTPVYGARDQGSKFHWEYIESETDLARMTGR